ncbi:major facilitator superfamily transporter monosaccharide [Sporothrix brasiliensis 5110]|uniref:Major facilitator superfamily transporter monosaccharide n=1 Tax=Sporothrix brasiliensis 5110 TaxID=1398154 RepID=A0A0C2IJD9_9PEZI|nr:major facilitator superfamily transporter monosaccharide [Sporothrix brasiliensis 5110]KIH89266.1 major facilitator superfamily transporter monosaccharide [Sporothrix brasiliensis 5110]
MTTAQTLGLTSAYFGGGYLFGPLVVGEWVLRHDEHHRRRPSVPYRQTSHREKRQRSRQASGLATIPATAATVASVATSAVTKHSRYSDSSENQIGGFKATFMVGLCFYGIGTIMFWPSAVLASFPGFLISSFVVGFGLSILETAANPFIVLCGPMEYAEMRLLLAQGTQGVGSVLSGLLADNVFFNKVNAMEDTKAAALLDVQWTYLAITLFCVVLILFFYYMPLPELHDAELEFAASRMPVDGQKRTIFGLQLRTVCLILAVFAQWTYVASQESMSIYFQRLVTSWLPGPSTANGNMATFRVGIRDLPAIALSMAMATSRSDSNTGSDAPDSLAVSVPNYLLIAHTSFSVSRFFTAYVVYLGVQHPKNRLLPTPRTILTISTALATLFTLLTVVLHPSQNANLIMVPVALFFFAEGPIWPLIFAIGLRGQGARTKRAAAYITMGASGPLFWPFVMYAVMRQGGTIQIAFIIVVALMAACTVYPLFLTFFRDARELTKVAPYDFQPGQAGGQHPARGFVGELDMTILGGGPDVGSPDHNRAPKTQPEQDIARQQD